MLRASNSALAVEYVRELLTTTAQVAKLECHTNY